MTSTTDMTEHPDVEEISVLTEGLLPPGRDAAVRRHLDECEPCTDVRASLEKIRGLLGTVPGPPHMPTEVASRIDTELAAEAPPRATTVNLQSITEPAGAEPVDTEPADTPSATPGEGREHVSRETAASREAAASTNRPAGRPRSSTTGPGRKGPMRRGRRRAAAIGTVFTVVALGLGTVLLSSQNEDVGDGPQTSAADTFSEGELRNQVSDLLARERTKTDSSNNAQTFGLESAPGPAISPRVLKSTVPECVRKGIGRDEAALATKEGTYEGRKVLLVVLADSSDATKVTTYIVDTACVSSPSSTTAKVLLKRSQPRD